MKKTLLLAVAILGFAFTSNAQEKQVLYSSSYDALSFNKEIVDTNTELSMYKLSDEVYLSLSTLNLEWVYKIVKGSYISIKDSGIKDCALFTMHNEEGVMFKAIMNVVDHDLYMKNNEGRDIVYFNTNSK
jgi:hypothetical protein